MNIKGFEQLRKHVPELNSALGRLRIVMTILFIFALTTFYFITTDRAIRDWSIDSQTVVMALGFLLVSFFFSKKKEYQQKYGELAYRNAFGQFALPGLSIIFAALAHTAYMNGPRIPPGWWTLALTILGWFLLLTGAVLWLRSIMIFGVDNLTALYVYYPQEGRLVQSKIYGILRHPLYSGLLRIGMGLALLNGNAFSVTFAILMPLGITGWVRLFEEKELIERFGASYLEYRKRVPAFWPRVRDLGAFFRFLIAGR